MSLLALQDLFRRYRDRATGVWKLGQEPGRTIYFDYGDTVFAQSSHLADRLTTILVERGRITQAQMDYALANLKPGISIGKNLIEMGFITQRDLLDVAKIQVERIIYGCMAQPDALPVFEARELDAHVVRLPLNTAQLLLSGILAIQDREWLLELLGPLNQVVVLQGKSLLDLTLPPDLAKLTPLLDGTHTLLELSRESQAEPVRVGAFALFLREMGWARLHEMPPVDRQALETALSPEAEPLPPPTPLPEPAPEPVAEAAPSLFETIQEAARPTTNLEHLSQSLDEPPAPPPAPEPLYLPEELQVPGIPEPDPGIQAETGQAELPTPSVELPPLPETVEEQPRVLLTVPPDDPGEPEAPPPAEEAGGEAPRPSPLRWAALGVLLAVVLAAGFFFLRRRSHPKVPKPLPGEPAKAEPAKQPPPPTSIAVPPKAEPEPPKAEPEHGKAEPAKPEPAKQEPAKPEPAKHEATKQEAAKQEAAKHEAAKHEAAKQEAGKHEAGKPEASKHEAAKHDPGKADPRKPEPKAVSASLTERLEAMRKGDLVKAVAQGAQHVKDAPAGHWALRLEIACQGETIRHVADLFKDGKPDLFLLPMTLRDGRTCYQVLYGNFPTKEAAEKESRKLPPAFGSEKNRPKLFKFSEIPNQQ